MIAHERSSEIRLLIILLALVGLFTFWMIPASVKDPEGFGYAQGLAPSFTVYMVAIFAAITLLARLVRVWREVPRDAGSSASLNENENDWDEPVHNDTTSQKRSWTIIGSCLLFAFILIPYAGFYASSFAFIVILAIIMGERRIIILVLLPAILLVGIYLGFEKGFTISLPRGEITLMILEALGSS
jgi:hypothetical protein